MGNCRTQISDWLLALKSTEENTQTSAGDLEIANAQDGSMLHRELLEMT